MWSFAALVLLGSACHLTFGIHETLERKCVDKLTSTEILNLQIALDKLENEDGPSGYQAISGMHGAPANCDYNGAKIACCIHGMPTFPAWHRLYVVQMERALERHGLNIGMPFWDWTRPLTKLPQLVADPIFIDPQGGKAKTNSWHSGEIKSVDSHTARAVDDSMFEKVEPGQYTQLFEATLDALEFEEYCQFEIQFEVSHNTLHILTGGRYMYSMSSLEYTSYDPIFFLHHSNVDRIFAIWQALQKARGKPWDHSNCAVHMFQEQMQPFNRDTNTDKITKSHSTADATFDYQKLGYTYSDLTLNDLSIDELQKMINERKSTERLFASFKLHGIYNSAKVEVDLCLPSGDPNSPDRCEHAGNFYILGGPTEMPWAFSFPYFFDVTKTIKKFSGADVSSDFYVKAGLKAVNGTDLPPDSIPAPDLIRRPGIHHADEIPKKADPSDVVTRKNIDVLTREEIYKLRIAFDRWKHDKSVDGFQAIAEYHGLPARCPNPDATVRWACCTHGMATFPHWHRLFMSQMEDALVARGSPIGVPYWDWALPMTALPAIAADESYTGPDGVVLQNPFYKAHIAFENKDTTRDILGNLLFESPAFGEHTYVFNAMMYAFEQDEFCDFEVAFEVVHNAVHLWVGGKELYSMAHLHYTAFDPIFYLHHSNVDRLWAIWQALQIRRGKPYHAHCAKSQMSVGLKPFAFKAPLNNNVKTQSHAVPNTVYDYENELGYTYDSLQFGGMNLDDLEAYINHQKKLDRTFAGFRLFGIKTSANVDVFVTKSGGSPYKAGTFPILGGSLEMVWSFDRPYMFEITDALKDQGLKATDSFTVTVTIKEFDGTVIDPNVLPKPIILFEPGTEYVHHEKEHVEIRKNVDTLTPQEEYELRRALEALKEDKTAGGFQQMAAFHGQPNWCPKPEAEKKYACCVHGMATFPHWHRMLTVQFENGLRRYGYTGALPYWEWTRPHTALPELAKDATYVNPVSQETQDNPWFKAHIDEANAETARSIDSRLYEEPDFNEYTEVTKQVLLALEQDDFCSFEVQYEIAHNLIHAFVGGNEVYSMGSLRYTAYDPIFFLHHAMTDRIWAIWQALQKYRGKPYNTANCALTEMRKPLSPFGLDAVVNPDPVTRFHASPFSAFNYESSFGYKYDNLDFNGLSVDQLSRELNRIRSKERVFAGFMLHGIKYTAKILFQVCPASGTNCHAGGEFYLLGDEYEMPWHYDRLYKYEITSVLDAMDLRYDDDVYYIKYETFALDGTKLHDNAFGTPSILHDRGTVSNGERYVEPITSANHVRKNLASLDEGEIESLRAAFKVIHDDGTYESIAKYHGYPGLCNGLACCIHGMPTFPHWHRLYVLHVERVLLKEGSSTAVPYWDWTIPMTKIPEILSDATYYNSRQQRFDTNPFFSGKITDKNAVTSRDPLPALFDSDYFYENTLLAFEQDNFCDFEIQYEITHNAFHLWLGGRSLYSMSSLEYSAFDPAFFVYHANTDRLWAIWQELQRYRNKPYNSADCAINEMHVPLMPFNKEENPNLLTKKINMPADVFDYQNNLMYKYDTLEFNGMNIPQLDAVLQDRKKHDRTFVGILLHGIKTSAEVTIYVCVPTGKGTKNCNNKAGVFTILGGPLEMPFAFDRNYKFDITPTLHRLGIDLQSHSFDIKFHITAPNGNVLSSDSLPKPTLIFSPGTDSVQNDNGVQTKYVVRKNINNLSPQETISLVKALKSMQADSSADGYQSIASFHALPPLCPSPSASKRYACCVHGMATFPQWHRLYTVQFGESLMKHGAPLCIPYWDWSRPQTSLPDLLTKDSFTDPVTGQELSNPWKKASIDFEGGVDTVRDIVNNKLFPEAKKGYKNWFYDQVMYALEQENYCDFEIQFEILHNGVHLWIGGNEVKSMSHLHYTSYDPSFYIHHSETDRIWAIWQELQQYRGLDGNEANCAIEMMKEPLKPFSFGPPWNLNTRTKEYSKPADAFNYKEHFGYIYDSLDFMGMTIPMIDSTIKGIQQKDRVFVGFMLKGFGKSANVDFQVCDTTNDCKDAGYFAVLGGSQEMPWNFDRLYKYDITQVLKDLKLHYDDAFTIKATVKEVDGTILHDILGTPSTLYVPGQDHSKQMMHSSNSVRREISTLGGRSLQNLISSLTSLQEDNGDDGFAAISSFHGLPAKCPDPTNPEYACCIHGMPAFPLWHRLYIRHFELALKRHGSFNAVPYWDWTFPVTELPSLLTDPSYYDAMRDKVVDNPWARGFIPSENTHTVRDLQAMLYKTSDNGKHSVLFQHVLLSLEQTNYCDFEVQFEVVHNWIHYLIGGRQEYSLSSLHWTSYDPMFYIHHAFVDKLFAVWQEMQKRRNLPHDRADCAINHMLKPMHPFNMDLNKNQYTKDHSLPLQNFNYEELGYTYDNLNIGGLCVNDLEEEIEKNKHKTRVFAGFLLKGVLSSADVEFEICKTKEDCYPGGSLFILGGTKEMPWAFDRLFKYDITNELEAAGIEATDVFNTDEAFYLKLTIFDMAGNSLPASSLPAPTIMYEAAEGASTNRHEHSASAAGVRKDVNNLTPSEIKNLRKAMAKVQADNGPNGFQAIAAMHGNPPMCKMADGKMYACCHHGMATFPHWHRLYTKQMEDALVAHGATIGIPYWDWTESVTKMPAFVTDEVDNSWHHGQIEYLGKTTTRDPRPRLFSNPEDGDESFFFRHVLLALEQTDYCAFEVQFEVTHNAIHLWTGGHTKYGMSTLDFTSYDPFFFIHHTYVDKIWAIWQALQRYRGLPYNEAYCEIQDLKEPLRPFNEDINPNPETRKHATAFDVFNYHSLNYQYDDLKLHGMSIAEIDDLINNRKRHDRVFVDFLLSGFKKSADVEFDICTKNHEVCKFGGTFSVLGGPYEMPWAFDRLYHYDVTGTMKELGLRYDADLDIVVKIYGIDGLQLDSSILHKPTMEFIPAVDNGYTAHSVHLSNKRYRKEVNTLSLDEVNELRNALYKFQNDDSKNGFEHIAGFHGAPFMCPEQGDDKYACCMHGMAIFPHWHRLFTVQFERALGKHGAKIGIPYWDWTQPFSSLPSFFSDSSSSNPFYKFHISGANQDSGRDPQTVMYNSNALYEGALEVLGEDNYCDFEVQFEILHNAVHYYIGGSDKFGMSTLEYSSFDPFFMIHHASIDRLWIIWQKLQRLRNKPFNIAPCAGKIMHMPLQPFSYPTVNADDFTLRHSDPDTVFDQDQFGYWYDTLTLHDQSVEELFTTINDLRHSTRIYAGFILSGIKTTAALDVWVSNEQGKEEKAGQFIVFGGAKEIPWAYERIYKMDITNVAKKLDMHHDSTFSFRTTMTQIDGTAFTDVTYPDPVIVYRPANSDRDIVIIPVGAGKTLPPKISVKLGTNVEFHGLDDSVHSMIDLGSYTTFYNCVVPPFSYNVFAVHKTYRLGPGDHFFTAPTVDQCKANVRIQIHVDDY